MASGYRFLFVLLGPPGKAKSYNEIGRAIATLMVDDVSINIVFLLKGKNLIYKIHSSTITA